MSEKTNGYLLLGIGIIVMLISVIDVLLVLTGNLRPPQVLSIQAPKLDLQSLMPELAGGLPANVQTPSFEVIPTASLNQMANISLNVFLMFFLLNFGFKLSMLGVSIVRPLKIEVRGGNDAMKQLLQEKPQAQ